MKQKLPSKNGQKGSLRNKYLWACTGILLLLYTFCLPRPLFDLPYSRVLEDQHGKLLAARIARDGQWRFPMADTLSEKYIQALIAFEDRRYWRHPGVDPLSIGRALAQNLKAGHVVSGGSTITMQVIRMARGGQRTIANKLIEMIMATRLELGHSKREILQLYTAHAPYGGNVVGIEAAAWRYFGKSHQHLSWGEAATLAVLPNSPGLLHPGRNRDALQAKRNRLLHYLHRSGHIDSLDWQLALAEPLPERPLLLPRLATHLLDRYGTTGQQPARIRTTLEADLQARIQQLALDYYPQLAANNIHNIAILVADIESGAVRAYMGNTPYEVEVPGQAVDVIPARRSTGSTLKPFLFAAAVQEGLITPASLLPDVPTYLHGYRPENYYNHYDGVARADQALVRSLNVPMVRLLQRYGLHKFHRLLQDYQLKTIDRPAEHYGLSLILGGAESSLWELCGAYADLGRTIRRYDAQQTHQRQDLVQPLHVLRDPAGRPMQQTAPLQAGAVWLTFHAMRQLERPDTEGRWRKFEGTRQVAWKTGTSFGFRDAWAIGVDGSQVVGVWVGNADGEGRPGLVGVRAAAPLMFRILEQLPSARWFDIPADDLRYTAICAESGYTPGPHCPADTLLMPHGERYAPLCSFHETIWVDEQQPPRRVTANCAAAGDRHQESYFVLPPLEAHFYRQRQPAYQRLPAWRADCAPPDRNQPVMQLVYPRYPAEIYVPIEGDGQPGATIFSLAHEQPAMAVHWHLDDSYLTTTYDFHSIEVRPPPGPHRLTLVDEKGRRLVQQFTILGK